MRVELLRRSFVAALSVTLLAGMVTTGWVFPDFVGSTLAGPTITQASQDPATGSQPTEAKAARKPPRGRLPTYFARVVNEKQRTEIYSIQAQYLEQIAKLQAQIEQLEAKRDQEVDAVLTDEQRAQVTKMREEAKARRRAKAEKKNSDDSGN